MSKLHGHNGNQPRGTQPRPSVSAAPVVAPPASAPSSVSMHAKEIMSQLIPLRHGYTPAAIAEEAFNLARAFADQATATDSPLTGESSHV